MGIECLYTHYKITGENINKDSNAVLWNVCNYERRHYKELGMEKYPVCAIFVCFRIIITSDILILCKSMLT